MWPFTSKNKAKEPKKSSEKRSTLFSTEISGQELAELQWEDLLAKSFQQIPSQLKPVDSSGKQLTTFAKPRPSALSIGRFAMDAPSEGNPLSMKPVIPVQQTIPWIQLAWYASQGFVGYQICGMLAQQWFIDKVCTIPPRDAMRHGYELTTEDDDKIDPRVLTFIRRRDKAFGIKQNCVEFVRFNRIFGIRIAMPIIETNDPNYYLKPFDINAIKPGTYKGLSQIDPYWITPELDFESAANPASIHFYEPTWWRVNGQRIHRTHLIIIRNGQVVDILKPTYYYGGVPVPQKIAERLYAAERTANEGPQLALTKRTTFMKVDITQALANLQDFVGKMNFFAQTRDNYGVKVGGLDDDFEQFDTSLTDFDDMTMMQFTIACAAADCPTTKIMGTSPKGGLGSEGEYDSNSYHEFLESLQANDMAPLIERHHELLIASEVRPKFGGKVPEGWLPTIIWNSTETIGAKQRSEINEINSRTGNNLTNSGAIDGVDERNRLKEDEDSGYNGLAEREPEIEEIETSDVTGDVKSDKSQAGEK